MKITKDDFYTYEVIRSSGLTNVFDIDVVIEYSTIMEGHVLSKDKIVDIMANYDKYRKKYPLPKNGVVAIKTSALEEYST